MNKRHCFLINILIGIMCILLLGCAENHDSEDTKQTTQIISEPESEIEKKPQVTAEPTKEPTAEPTTVPAKEETKPAEEPKKEEQSTEAEGNERLKKLQVDGTQLVDEDGNPVQLKGLSTHGLSWFPQYVNQELFTELSADWNCNVVRLAMYSAEYNGYCTGGNKEELKQLIKDGVQYAENAGLYVIVDWHVLGEGDPNTYKEEAKAFFDEMSKEFADKQHVIYEICNEPNGGVNWASVKSYALEVIPVIRANDEDAVIIVGTPTWSQDVDKAAADPITEYDNIMYALHFYAATHKEDIRNRMVNALGNGLPIIVSEYGICSADGNGGIDAQQAQAWINLMDEKNVSYVAWNLSNKNETSAVFESGCSKTNGFTKDDLSDGGRWLYDMLTSEENMESTTQDADTNHNDNLVVENGMEYQAIISNSWESDNKKYEQYCVELKNISDKEINGWEIELEFENAFQLSDSWNGNYSIQGKKLIIKNVDYNALIKPDEEVKDIGFIICY